MCELFAVSAVEKVKLNTLLEEFFSHSSAHPNGWGMVVLDSEDAAIEKEDVKADNSQYLQEKLKNEIVSANLIAHIRRATIGSLDVQNNHPFERTDVTGRRWILAHNGTIFESDKLGEYYAKQEGTTDSERILLYIVDKINQQTHEKKRALSEEERFSVIDQIVVELSAGNNKLNLIVYDGDYYYIHKNQEETLYVKNENGAAIIATTPLDNGAWNDIPLNCLQVYQNGQVVKVGTHHEHEYIYEEERYRELFMEYAAL